MLLCTGTYIGVGTLCVLPVRFASLKLVLSLCLSHVMHMTSMGLGSCSMSQVQELFGILLLFTENACVHLASLGLQHRPMVSFGLHSGGLPDKSSFLFGVFICLLLTGLFIQWLSTNEDLGGLSCVGSVSLEPMCPI